MVEGWIPRASIGDRASAEDETAAPAAHRGSRVQDPAGVDPAEAAARDVEAIIASRPGLRLVVELARSVHPVPATRTPAGWLMPNRGSGADRDEPPT